jgi:hypothetical protein
LKGLTAIEKFLFYLSILLSTFSFYGFILTPKTFVFNFEKSSSVGKLKSYSGVIRYRKRDALKWVQMSEGETQLYKSDKLFTSENSTAEVLLSGGATVFLSENTLIRIDKINGEDYLGIIKGLVKINLEKSRKLKVKEGFKVLELEGGENAIVIKKNMADLELLEGRGITHEVESIQMPNTVELFADISEDNNKVKKEDLEKGLHNYGYEKEESGLEDFFNNEPAVFVAPSLRVSNSLLFIEGTKELEVTLDGYEKRDGDFIRIETEDGKIVLDAEIIDPDSIKLRMPFNSKVGKYEIQLYQSNSPASKKIKIKLISMGIESALTVEYNKKLFLNFNPEGLNRIKYIHIKGNGFERKVEIRKSSMVLYVEDMLVGDYDLEIFDWSDKKIKSIFLRKLADLRDKYSENDLAFNFTVNDKKELIFSLPKCELCESFKIMIGEKEVFVKKDLLNQKVDIKDILKVFNSGDSSRPTVKIPIKLTGYTGAGREIASVEKLVSVDASRFNVTKEKAVFMALGSGTWKNEIVSDSYKGTVGVDWFTTARLAINATDDFHYEIKCRLLKYKEENNVKIKDPLSFRLQPALKYNKNLIGTLDTSFGLALDLNRDVATFNQESIELKSFFSYQFKFSFQYSLNSEPTTTDSLTFDLALKEGALSGIDASGRYMLRIENLNYLTGISFGYNYEYSKGAKVDSKVGSVLIEAVYDL